MIEPIESEKTPRWAKVVDHEVCIGCHACSTACKSENEVPLSVNRTYVKYVDVGEFPEARRAFQVTRCNQCADPPCAEACPTSAMFQRPDGIVDFDKSICIGCKACIAACPYDAIFINPEDHSAEKCNFCAHRIDVDLEPACVVVCPTEAIMVGDLNDPTTRVAQMVNREPVTVRRPEKETAPKLFYRGAHQATLDPLAARRPEGDLFMWSQQTTGGHHVVSGHSGLGLPEGSGNSAAAAMLSYDVPHQAPWDWKVSLYTLTKGIAAGAYLVPALAALFGVAGGISLLAWIAPLVALVFLGITGALLIWDLEQPTRFYMIFTRPQWRSWLVRGAFIIAAYGLALVAHLALGRLWRLDHAISYLAPIGSILALLTAVYTAYLFAQAKARDLWQNPLLPPHLAVQAALAGAAVCLPIVEYIEPQSANTFFYLVGGLNLLHLTLIVGELTLTHSTAHARLAAAEMTHGRFRAWFWGGIVLSAVGALALWTGSQVAVVATLAGLFAFEHAYVQSGQSVPLA